MKHSKTILAAGSTLLALAILAHSGYLSAAAEDGAKKSRSQKQNDSASKTATKKKARGRLPNFYGKIGLSKTQRQEIYDIQAKFRAQIEELEKKLAQLREQQDKELQAVLTQEQKKALDQLQKADEQRRKSRRKKPANQ